VVGFKVTGGRLQLLAVLSSSAGMEGREEKRREEKRRGSDENE